MTLDSLLEDLRDSFGERITDIRSFEQAERNAGTKSIFTGRDGFRNVILTVVKQPRNGVAKSVVKAGYGLGNEISIAKRFGVDEASENHLAVTYETLETKNGETVALSPEIQGVCLADYKGGFDLEGFRSFFGQAISTQQFMIGKGVYHRDLSPYNLLVRKNGKLEALTIDLGSACEKETAKAETLTTRGARTVRDPRVFSNGHKYGDAQEIYALAQNMLVALTGKPAVKYDAEQIKRWDPEAHDAAIKQAIKNLPKWARRRWTDTFLGRISYEDMIYKAMSSEGNYSSISAFQDDFEKASKLRTWERIKKNKAIPTLGLLGLVGLGLGYGVVDELRSDKQVLEQIVQEARKYQVTTEWDGFELELNNNLLELTPSIAKREPYKSIYNEDVKPRFIKLEKGDKLYVMPTSQLKPLPGEASRFGGKAFRGKVYFEGFPATEFFSDPIIPDPSQYDMSGPMIPHLKINVPEDMPEGVWNLAIELYSPSGPDGENFISMFDFINFENPGRAIARKRIPVIIGNPEVTLNPRSFKVGAYSEYLSLERLAGNVDPTKKGISYEYSIPEIGYKEIETQEKCSFNPPCSRFSEMPNPTDEREVTLQIIIRDGGKIVNYSAFPIRGKKVGKSCWWDWSVPGPSFSEKLVQYRKQAAGEIKEAFYIPPEDFREFTFEDAKAGIIDSHLQKRYNGYHGMMTHYQNKVGKIDERTLAEIRRESIPTTLPP